MSQKLTDKEIDMYKKGYERYENVRKLNASQFADLYKKNIES